MKQDEKLIRSIDAKFKSGNEIPVREVRLTWEEWTAIRMICAAHIGWSHYEPTEQGRAYLGGSSRG